MPKREPTPEHERLNAFAGTWNTRGQIRASSAGPAMSIQATDVYEWLRGGFFLIHRWDAQMPDGITKGIEILGYDEATNTYPMRSFDSHGNSGLMHATVEGAAWTFTGDTLRFTGHFRDGGNTFAGLWEHRSADATGWIPWMDIELTRAPEQSLT